MSPVFHSSRCGLAVALIGFAWASAAWASYGQMRLDGITFLLVVVALCGWGVVLFVALALRWCKNAAFAAAAIVATCVLVYVLIAVFGDGRATMQPRPLRMGAMFVVLLLATVPVMLATPILQWVQHARGTPSGLPAALLGGVLVLVPIGSGLHLLVQEALEMLTLEQARALTPGRILPHVIASRNRAAGSWLSPYFWNEEAELKWIAIGVSGLGFVENPAPVSDEDTQALELLVKSLAGPVWKLESKLFWDRLMRAVPGDRVAVAAGLTQHQARRFNEAIVVLHAEWLCAPLADPETEKAFGHVRKLLGNPNEKESFEQKEFSAAIREKCGRSIGDPAK